MLACSRPLRGGGPLRHSAADARVLLLLTFRPGRDAEDRLIYDRASGSLYFDADGTGSTDAVLFAMLDSRPLITAADVEIV